MLTQNTGKKPKHPNKPNDIAVTAPFLVSTRHDLSAIVTMALSEALIKKLAKGFPPDEMIDGTFAGNDFTIKTDGDGNAILLFIGRRLENGHIKGERYARRLLFGKEGKRIKDHWENKGRSS